MSRKTSSRSSSPVSSVSTTKPVARSSPKAGGSALKLTKPQSASKVDTKASPPAAKPVEVVTKPASLPSTTSAGGANGCKTVAASAGSATSGASVQPSRSSSNGHETANQLLTRAEQDITTAIDSLNKQMNTALSALAELATAQTERGKVVVRTAPLDRATAVFQRLVAEVVDDQLGEMLPPLIALRNEAAQWSAGGQGGTPESDFSRRSVETLDHVLALAGVTSFDARSGQTFDPLIHLAVGESRRNDLAEGAVAECIQPGYRSSRGKVLSPARVRINRR